MLNGVAPILLINLKTLTPKRQAAIRASSPLIADIVDAIDLPIIPIYLSRELTGLALDSKDKNIDIETVTDTLSTGGTPKTNQRALSSRVTVNLIAERDSVGIILLSALFDVIYPKTSSKEYSITLLAGATTVFAGLLHSFAVNETSDNTLLKVQIVLIIGDPKTKTEKANVPQVSSSTVGVVPSP